MDSWRCMRRMVEAGSTGVRLLLRDCKEGSWDHDVEDSVAAALKHARCDVYPHLVALFSDPDPRARAFAADVASQLGDERYVEPLKKLLQDRAALPRPWEETVAQHAQGALRGIAEKRESPFQEPFDRETGGP
jgi:HEAT repeat protein